MAKIDENKYKRALLQRTEGYAASVRVIYLDVMERLISLALEVEPIHDPKKPFSFTDYPTISDKANVLLRELYTRVYQQIRSGVINEWEQANLKSDELVRSVFGKKVVDNEHFARYFGRNKKAMDSFFARRSGDDGLNHRRTNYIYLRADLLQEGDRLPVREHRLCNRHSEPARYRWRR